VLPGRLRDARDAALLRQLHTELQAGSSHIVTIGFGEAAVTAARVRRIGARS
jgi:hypothetical protein